MKLTPQKLTHAAAGIFGLLLAFALLHRQAAGSSGPSSADGQAAHPRRAGQPQPEVTTGDAKNTRGQRRDPIPKFRSSEYRKAWDAIADQSLPASQRYFLQVELLRQWAEVDLEGALSAAFDTSWDGSNNGMGLQSMLQAFDGEFAKRPTESWDLITSGRFGLGAALAKGTWARAVVKENPFLVVNYLSEIPLQTRHSIFPQVLAAIKEDPSKIGAFYDKLKELPQDIHYLEFVGKAVEALGPRGTMDEIRAKFQASTSEAERSLLVHEFGKSVAGMDSAVIQAQLAQLPEEDRGRMLRSAAIHMPPGENPTQMVELLLQAREIKQVSRQMNDQIQAYANTPEKQADIAAWAVNLPRMPDAAAVIHRSVAGYVMNNPQGARTWLESVPADTWGRNTALAEYSQQMLWKHNDPEESAWALAQIQDPKLKEEATKWRGSWEKQNGKR